MDINFSGKRALVTGGGSGIGRATALRLAQLGAKVFALSHIQADLDSLKKENPKIEILCVDLREWAKTRDSVKSVTPIHLLVNCAGVCVRNTLLDVPEKEFDHVFGVNVKGMLNVTQVVAKDLMDRNAKGAIVNISSLAGHLGYPNYSTYCAAVRAIMSYTMTMAVELSPKGIRVNGISPTLVMTKMGKWIAEDGVSGPFVLGRTPMSKLPEVEDIVNPIVYLLSDKSDMINGHNLPVEGGFLAV